jgi:hypothetical protein
LVIVEIAAPTIVVLVLPSTVLIILWTCIISPAITTVVAGLVILAFCIAPLMILLVLCTLGIGRMGIVGLLTVLALVLELLFALVLSVLLAQLLIMTLLLLPLFVL